MSEKILTISIAAYNVERFLDDILLRMQNCVNKSYLEVIVIDDGSIDATSKIASSYSEKNPSVFKTIHKENGGWGSTVNTGISNATGRYFKLLDGDDYFETKDLDDFLNELRQMESDMIMTPFRTFENKTGKTIRLFKNPKQFSEKKNYRLYDIVEKIYPRMHSITFKTEVLKRNGIKITENCFYTDVEYVLRTLPYIESVSFSNICLYNYRVAQNGQSVSPEGLKEHYKDHITVIKQMLELYDELQEHTPIKKFFRYRIAQLIESQYNIFLIIGKSEIIRNEYIRFDVYLKNGYPFYYKGCSIKVKLWRIFNEIGLYRVFVTILNVFKRNSSI